MASYDQPGRFGTFRKKEGQILAAGGIVLRQEGPDILMLIVEREDAGKWAPMLRQIPKGRCEEGEMPEQAALREVAEETGFNATIVEHAGEAGWSFVRDGLEYEKHVHYFLMAPLSLEQGVHDGEYQYVRWIEMDKAVEVLSYPEERQLVREVIARLER